MIPTDERREDRSLARRTGEPPTTHSAQARDVAEHRASGERVKIDELGAGATLVQVLGVSYAHQVTAEGGDLYLTSHGLPLVDHLQPSRWYVPDWFSAQAERLDGTGAVYALPTRPLRGESVALVVKFSRVGERVPIDTQLIEDVLCCEFNGPFEEFALLEELRASDSGPPGLRVRTQLPLAIYVPPERSQPSQLGRFQWRVARKVAQHPGIAIDIMRQYLMLYGWLPGIDAREAQALGYLSPDEVIALNARAMSEMRAKGFSVLDMKPNHVIVRAAGPRALVRRDGEVDFGVVDFELLERTPEHYARVTAARRLTYERRARALLAPGEDAVTASAESTRHGVQTTRVLGVDYVHGRNESTGGLLWVVGRDPELFDYYLPERWRTTPQLRFVDSHETYFTITKDGVPLVWKVSRVGERPEVATLGTDGFRVLAHGFNSPFEEVGLAWWLRRRGIPVIVPRAIYRTGHRSQLAESQFDQSRYRSHASLRTAEGAPILETRRNYVTLWDHWNGPPGELAGAAGEEPVFRSLNAQQAVERRLITLAEATSLLEGLRAQLDAAEIEVLRLAQAHLLVALDADGALLRGPDGAPPWCLCNLQSLRWPWPLGC